MSSVDQKDENVLHPDFACKLQDLTQTPMHVIVTIVKGAVLRQNYCIPNVIAIQMSPLH